jgi:hypothetical protein
MISLKKRKPVSKKQRRLSKWHRYVERVESGRRVPWGLEFSVTRGLKKMRGWKNKHFFTVKISQITEEGFWIRNEGKSFYICRKQYPWFIGATDREIRNVDKRRSLHEDSMFNDMYWNLLDMRILMLHLYRPETMKLYGVYVRGEMRQELLEEHLQWLAEHPEFALEDSQDVYNLC